MIWPLLFCFDDCHDTCKQDLELITCTISVDRSSRGMGGNRFPFQNHHKKGILIEKWNSSNYPDEENTLNITFSWNTPTQVLVSNLHKDKINKLWAENAFYENSLVGLKFVKFYTTLYFVFIIIRSNFIQMSVNFTLLRAETKPNKGWLLFFI